MPRHLFQYGDVQTVQRMPDQMLLTAIQEHQTAISEGRLRDSDQQWARQNLTWLLTEKAERVRLGILVEAPPMPPGPAYAPGVTPRRRLEQRLQELKLQKNTYGISADPSITIEIQDIEAQLRRM